MCGIAGIAGFRGSKELLERDAAALLAHLRHRGPDAEGTHIWPEAGAGLVHTRLSVIDLSQAGQQPMAFDNERYWLSFNGEIYNHEALRAELAAGGERFVSKSDTEVLLRLLVRDGVDALGKLRGMYALALWDARERTLLLARDPLGIKPLYVAQYAGTVVFASEVRAMLATSLVARTPSTEGVYGFLRTGSVPEPYTLVDGVTSLPAGHFLEWQSGSARTQRFWSFPQSGDALDAKPIAGRALRDSVTAHLVSDVPVGVFLSGGLDSAAILAGVTEVQGAPPASFSIGVDAPQLDESASAARVAAAFKADHHHQLLDFNTASALLPDFLASLDQPSIDGFNTFCVARLARDSGLKVVLSGIGGDELFGGYPSFSRVPALTRWRARLAFAAGPVASLLRQLEPVLSPRARRLADLFAAPASLGSSYAVNRAIFSATEARELTRKICGREPDQGSLYEAGQIPLPADAATAVSVLEISRYLRNQLLRDSDVMSMSVGLELRTPLVDSAFVEQIWAISASVRLAPGKQLLRDAASRLPPWVGTEAKRGFTLPFGDWLQRGLLRDLPVPESAASAAVSLAPWYRQWSLAVLDTWQRRHLA